MRKLAFTMMMAASVLAACNNEQKKADETDTMDMDQMEVNDGMTTVDKPTVKAGKYINLTSGEEVSIKVDPVSGLAIDEKTQIPVEFYYDPITLDTIYQNGMVVNHLLVKEGKGKYKLDDMKIKIDGDEIKIKTDSSKMKIDGDEMKVKDESGKMKTDGEEMKVKPSN